MAAPGTPADGAGALSAALPEPPLTVAVVARRLGVAPATLRTWDRRYGIGPSGHAAGSHRRYLPDDVARLEVMRRLTRSGVTPGEAARAALDTDGLARPPHHDGAPAVPPRVRGPSRAGGGRVLPLAEAGAAARGLARAAMALDAGAVSSTVRAALERQGVVETWDGLLVPVLRAAGDRWEATHEGVDAEHLLSECVVGALLSYASRRSGPEAARPVLLAAAEEEMHSLPLYAVAATLAEQGRSARILGARVPRDAMAAAFRRLGPAALFVWAQLPANGDPGQLSELPVLRPAPVVVVGGPGWPLALPDGVQRADHLADAVGRLVAAGA